MDSTVILPEDIWKYIFSKIAFLELMQSCYLVSKLFRKYVLLSTTELNVLDIGNMIEKKARKKLNWFINKVDLTSRFLSNLFETAEKLEVKIPLKVLDIRIHTIWRILNSLPGYIFPNLHKLVLGCTIGPDVWEEFRRFGDFIKRCTNLKVLDTYNVCQFLSLSKSDDAPMDCLKIPPTIEQIFIGNASEWKSRMHLTKLRYLNIVFDHPPRDFDISTMPESLVEMDIGLSATFWKNGEIIVLPSQLLKLTLRDKKLFDVKLLQPLTKLKTLTLEFHSMPLVSDFQPVPPDFLNSLQECIINSNSISTIKEEFVEHYIPKSVRKVFGFILYKKD